MSSRWSGPCVGCGVDSELRGGWCYDCAHNGERIAANRTVWQHLRACVRNVARRRWLYARFDACWAWQRLTTTGDYKPGGYFARQGHFQ